MKRREYSNDHQFSLKFNGGPQRRTVLNYRSILKSFQQIGHKSITQSQGQNPQHVLQ